VLDYIKGQISELNPANMVIETNGIGYFINISLNTYSKLTEQKNVKIFIHEIIREDTHELYGFYTQEERNVYRKLISVSGVGPSTARIMLSSLDVNEIYNAIANNDVNTIKSVKGIGLKTAQRIIVDLKDKIKNIEENIKKDKEKYTKILKDEEKKLKERVNLLENILDKKEKISSKIPILNTLFAQIAKNNVLIKKLKIDKNKFIISVLSKNDRNFTKLLGNLTNIKDFNVFMSSFIFDNEEDIFKTVITIEVNK